MAPDTSSPELGIQAKCSVCGMEWRWNPTDACVCPAKASHASGPRLVRIVRWLCMTTPVSRGFYGFLLFSGMYWPVYELHKASPWK